MKLEERGREGLPSWRGTLTTSGETESCADRSALPALSPPAGRSCRFRSPVAAASRLLLPRTCTASACTYAPRRGRMWSGMRPPLGRPPSRSRRRGVRGPRWPCPVAGNLYVRGGPWWPRPTPALSTTTKFRAFVIAANRTSPKRSRQAARYSGVTRGSLRSSSLLSRKARTAGSMQARGWSSPVPPPMPLLRRLAIVASAVPS
jgi:hypothetical protein